MYSDADLVRAAQNGDGASLGILLERHRATLYALALRMLGSGPDAQDAVHDSFLVALRHIDRLRQPEAAGGWLRGIARNVCLRRLSQGHREAVFAGLSGYGNEKPGASAAEEAIDRLALRDWVWTAISALPEALRVTAMLRYFGTYASYDEIALILGIPVGTVRSRLNQVKVKLAEALLETAELAHDEARQITEVQTNYFGAAFAEYNRGDGYGMLADAFSDDCVIAFSDGSTHHGRGWVIDEGEGDLDAGMKLHLTNVVASRDVTVIEGNYENPPDNPFRCPPAISMVGFYHDGQIGRMRMYYAQRPTRQL